MFVNYQYSIFNKFTYNLNTKIFIFINQPKNFPATIDNCVCGWYNVYIEYTH